MGFQDRRGLSQTSGLSLTAGARGKTGCDSASPFLSQLFLYNHFGQNGIVSSIGEEMFAGPAGLWERHWWEAQRSGGCQPDTRWVGLTCLGAGAARVPSSLTGLSLLLPQ